MISAMMDYFIQAEVKIQGRWKRLYLWQSDLWRESRSDALRFASRELAQIALDRLQTLDRPLRNLNIVSADETTAPYHQRPHRPIRKQWKESKN
jgi:hypothetical protein